MLTLEQVNIRDPFLLPYQGTYYLYGTRSDTCWGKADGFDCYTSTDLEHWEGPIEIFHRPEGFPYDENYWAPECYAIDGRFYFLTTFGGGGEKKGVFWLVSDRPTGPFVPYGGRLTPADWVSIDGTLYQSGGKNYLFFSHSFEDGSCDGDLCLMELSDDLKTPVTAPVVLFPASAGPWTVPIPFAKEEFGVERPVYFSDGPFVVEENGVLRLFWSSWGKQGYAVGEARSVSGDPYGPWEQVEIPYFAENGGHGMAFRRWDGTVVYTLHYPDHKYQEHPIFRVLEPLQTV
jgi:GH43 family beta-xylosidase